MKPILLNFTDPELESYIVGMGQPKFRAKQIREWLLRGAPDFSVMKNIPEKLRSDLDSVAQTLPVKIIKKLESSDGETTKFLLELSDGEQIESVVGKGYLSYIQRFRFLSTAYHSSSRCIFG